MSEEKNKEDIEYLEQVVRDTRNAIKHLREHDKELSGQLSEVIKLKGILSGTYYKCKKCDRFTDRDLRYTNKEYLEKCIKAKLCTICYDQEMLEKFKKKLKEAFKINIEFESISYTHHSRNPLTTSKFSLTSPELGIRFDMDGPAYILITHGFEFELDEESEKEEGN